MTLAALALCLATGILWADAGRDSVPGFVVFASASIGCIACAVRTACTVCIVRKVGIRSGWNSSSASCQCSGRARTLGFLAAGLIAFDAGHESLDVRLRSAERDAARAQIAVGEGIRIAEARVVSRRSGRWADEIELAQVRAADGGSELPRRLLLRLRVGRADTDAAESRANSLLWPGASLRMGLRIAPIRTLRSPGSVDREGQAARRGIAARARLVDPAWVVARALRSHDTPALREVLRRAREAVQRKLGERLARAGDASGLARALALGDRTGLTAGLREDFRRLGLSHLLAVSGLHVALVAGLVGWLGLRGLSCLRPGLVDPFPAVIWLAALGAVAYAWLCGGSVSVQRAAWGFVLVGLFALLRRAPRPLALLSGIAAALWVVDPATLFDLGAQLSFSACLGLVAAGVWRGSTAPALVGPPRPGAATIRIRIQRQLALTLRASCAASFGTATILAINGLASAWLAPLVNLVAVPWTAFAVLPASLLAALGAALCTWVAPDSRAAEPWLGALLWPAQGLVEGVAWGAARLPGRMPDGIGCEFAVAVASALGLACLRAGGVKSVILCWLALVLVGGVPRVDHDLWAERPRVWFFDIGQGDAALFEGRLGSMLVDTGPGPPDGSGGLALVRSLRAVGRDAIDLLVVTHADLDHRGGAVRVLQTLRVAELWLPAAGRTDPALLDLAALARAQGTVVSWRSADSQSETRGDLRIETLWPPRLAGPGSRNAGSLVLRVELESRFFLLMADVDSQIELRLSHEVPDQISADFLKVSHHGSRGGTDRAFLEGVAARHAIVSAPCLSSRGLPNPQTLDRIRRSASRLWWTGRDGAVVVFPGRHPGPDEPDEVVPWAVPRRCSE